MQEGLSNVAQHAGASEVAVTLAQRDGELELNVKDDGQGLGAAAAADERTRSRMGVLGMRERVAPLGGTVELSDPGAGGVELCIRIPLDGVE